MRWMDRKINSLLNSQQWLKMEFGEPPMKGCLPSLSPSRKLWPSHLVNSWLHGRPGFNAPGVKSHQLPVNSDGPTRTRWILFLQGDGDGFAICTTKCFEKCTFQFWSKKWTKATEKNQQNISDEIFPYKWSSPPPPSNLQIKLPTWLF